MADHLVVDCATGEATARGYSPDEQTVFDVLLAAQRQAVAEERRQRADMETVLERAAHDPAFAALARLLRLD